MNDFKRLGINDELISNLEKNGITKPTKVQVRAIPLIMKGRDVIVQSETGSGKTISFAIPIINNSKPLRRTQALIITPTRELAKQVSNEFIKYKTRELSVTVVYGGVSIEHQLKQARASDIIIGTPGRLLDLLNRHALNLAQIKFLVLDEADRMLDMGFINDIKRIIKHTPRSKQTLLFSATINGKVIRLSEQLLHNPARVELSSTLRKGVLKQYYYDVEQWQKIPLLVHLLKNEKGLTLVFCATKRSTEYITRVLTLNGIRAECMNGNMSQKAREKVINNFINKKTRVLVATDVAARGLHVNDIKLVINLDLPRNPETYTHRVGRTARNGKTGTAIIILSDKDYPLMHKIKAIYGDELRRRKTPKFNKVIKRSQKSG